MEHQYDQHYQDSVGQHEATSSQQNGTGQWALAVAEDHDMNRSVQHYVGEETVGHLLPMDHGGHYDSDDSPIARQLKMELIRERQARAAEGKVMRQIFGIVQNFQQSLQGIASSLPANMIETQEYGFPSLLPAVPAYIDGSRPPRPKPSRSRNRTSKQNQQQSNLPPSTAPTDSGALELAYPAPSTPRPSPRPKSSRANGSINFWGRQFLLFAVDHFEAITTGWAPIKYPQGRPSMDRSYASIISLLAYLRRHDLARFERYIQSFSFVQSRDAAYAKYSNLINNMDSGTTEDTSPYELLYDREGDGGIRPLKQNELQFQPYANAYISCFGFMQGRDFVLYDTPKEFPPDLVVAMTNQRVSEDAVATMTATTHHHHAAPQSYDPSPFVHSRMETSQFDAYPQADIMAYSQSHGRGAQNQHSIVLQGDNDGSAELLRSQMDVASPAAPEPSARDAARKRNYAEAQQQPSASDSLHEEVESVRHDVLPPIKTKRKRKHRSETQAPVVQEQNQEDQDPNIRHGVGGQDEPASTNADSVAEAPPAPKKRTMRGRIVGPDGKWVIVPLQPNMTVYKNEIVTKDYAARQKLAAQKEAAQSEAAQKVAEPVASPGISSPPAVVSPPIVSSPVPAPAEAQQPRNLRKKWIGSGYQPTPKKI